MRVNIQNLVTFSPKDIDCSCIKALFLRYFQPSSQKMPFYYRNIENFGARCSKMCANCVVNRFVPNSCVEAEFSLF